jgi:methyl-accepting chemotaxis protein
MFQQMKIKARILTILGVLAGGYLILLAIVQLSASATHSRMSQISTSIFPAALKMQEAEAAFERMKKHYGDAVVLQDAKALQDAAGDAQVAEQALGVVKNGLASVPHLAPKAESLESDFAQLSSREHDTYTAVLNNKGGPTDEMMGAIGALGKSNQTLTASMTELDKAIAAEFQQQLDAVDAWSLRSRLTGLVMLVFAVLSCGAAWRVVQRQLVQPLQGLSLRIQDIAEGEGDLTRRVEVRGNNEIDEVGIWFNAFLDKLQDMMRQVKENTRQLAEASRGLTNSANGMAQGAEAQQMKTAMVATSMHEMSSTVVEVSQNSNSAALKTRQAADDARDGGRVVEETIQLMHSVTQSVDKIAHQIQELGERSNQVGNIIDVIDEIAGRTNLLALNAAIEAARAGEQGRGFAVVAGEVRNLAERTTKATKEIAETIGLIQQETRIAVEAMGQGTAQVGRGVTATGEAGVKLRLIIESADAAAAMVNQIAAAAAEQTATTEEVNSNVSEIARISTETASESRQSAQACEELGMLAGNLSQLVGRFRTGEEGNGPGVSSQTTIRAARIDRLPMRGAVTVTR